MNLLEKAQSYQGKFRKETPKNESGSEKFELLMAYLKGEIHLSQLSYAMGKDTTSPTTNLASLCRDIRVELSGRPKFERYGKSKRRSKVEKKHCPICTRPHRRATQTCGKTWCKSQLMSQKAKEHFRTHPNEMARRQAKRYGRIVTSQVDESINGGERDTNDALHDALVAPR